jgi:hypothetical protein
MANKKSNSGLSLTAVLFIVFLVLKLTGNIDWSWWWVTSPLWIPFAVVLGLVFIVVILIVLGLIFGMSVDDIKEKIDILKK